MKQPASRRRRQPSRLMAQLRRRPLPAWTVALLHLLALGIALVLFALPHHVIPRSRESLGVVSTRDAAPAAVATAAPEAEIPQASDAPGADAASEAQASEAPAQPGADASEQPVAARTGDFSAKFADKFVEGEPVITDTSYVSQNISITITEYYVKPTRFYVADIYVRDISCFRTGFAKGKYGRNITEDIGKVMEREQGVLAINGDYYGVRDKGACMRNGELYHSKAVVRDACVLYWDGRMECFDPEDFDCDTEVANGAYQIWSFGPSVLNDDGTPREDYPSINKDISGNQPRSALGYFEPGHYCFITAEGRLHDSRGLTFKQLGIVAQNLGCKECYNMDGGQTAKMQFGDRLVNTPSGGGRNCSDYLVIVDRVS